MSAHDEDTADGVSRRKVLECMTWAGTGVLWTVAGGIPTSLGIMGEAPKIEQTLELLRSRFEDNIKPKAN